MLMPDNISKYPFVNKLAANFTFYLKYYADHCPFTKFGQLEYHLETIRRRLELGSARAALEDEAYLRNLYRTLKAWGIGSRGSKLRPFKEFVSALVADARQLSELDGLELDRHGLEIDLVARQAWELIRKMDIVGNQAKLVPVSKTLHHLLPDVITPIDKNI
jgi:hypothetical protein